VGCSGAILVGGKSSRMGKNKALMRFDDVPMVARVAATLRHCSSLQEHLLITNTPSDYEFLGWPMHADLISNAGALGGIYTALSAAQQPRVFVVACDLPFLSAELVEFLCRNNEGAEVVVPESENGLEPLCAVYAKSCLPMIEKQLRAKRFKVSDFYPQARTEIVRLEPSLPFFTPNVLTNINTPEEFARAQALFGDLHVERQHQR
jgi:molybdopterin-guanine dinucleotide biosynthesis protein A